MEGKIFIEFEDEVVEINEGEMIVVPKGVKHKPYAEKEAKIIAVAVKFGSVSFATNAWPS